MPTRFNDNLESSGPFPLVEADQMGGVVTDVTLSGQTLTVSKKDADDKATTNTSDITLPSASATVADGSITANKLADGAVSTNKLAGGAVTNAKIANSTIAEGKLATAVVNKLNAQGSGLDQGQVDARIAAAKASAVPVMLGWLQNGVYKAGGGQIGDASKWAASNHVHPWREHEAEVFNAFDGDAWEDTTDIEFAVTTAGGKDLNFTQGRPATNTARTYHYSSATLNDVSPARVNRWLTFRVSEANVDDGSLRANYDLGGTAGAQPPYTVLDQVQDNNFVEVDRWTDSEGNDWVAYSQFMQNLAEATKVGGQRFDKFEIDLDRVDIANILQRAHATDRLGSTTLIDGVGAGAFVSSLDGNHRSLFTLFSPTFDLDTAQNQHGEIIGEAVLSLHQLSSQSVGFGTEHDKTHRFDGFVFASRVRSSTVYSATALNGVAIDSIDIYDASTHAGTITLYLARNSNNELGYYYAYQTRTGYVGSGNFNVASNLAFAFEHTDAAPAQVGPEMLLNWRRSATGDYRAQDWLTEVPAALAFTRALTGDDDGKVMEIQTAWSGGSAAQTNLVWSFADFVDVSKWRAITGYADGNQANDAGTLEGQYTAWALGALSSDAPDTWQRFRVTKGANGRLSFSTENATAYSLQAIEVRLIRFMG